MKVFEGSGHENNRKNDLVADNNRFFNANISSQRAKDLNITAKKSSHQFPFFDSPTPVWAYNGSIPGPTIRGQEGANHRD